MDYLMRHDRVKCGLPLFLERNRMPKKRTKPTRNDNPPPQHLSWEFPPNIPTRDFFDGRDPADRRDLELILDDFLWIMEQKDFLTWEAVVCDERGIPLSIDQKFTVV